MNEIRVIPISGIPEIRGGDDLAALLVEHLPEPLEDGDVVVVTQKVVSKAEGRLVPASERKAHVASESVATLRRSVGGMTIAETRHGFICANAGVDSSNVEGDQIALLPVDPDASARRIRARLERATSTVIGVVVSDTFGRAWRLGQTDVAIGVAGLEPFLDHRGTLDTFGNELHATRICVADEIAGAAELVMGKADGICAAIVRGVRIARGRGAATEIVRSPADDLFR
ncbi:MAG TPA: coenzyme F420-0:L-glutamate ligase [Actinomycetota bacterium]|nr:coenzyme F420-0:L-glutamate ligase [Actinomycetota bacterium]